MPRKTKKKKIKPFQKERKREILKSGYEFVGLIKKIKKETLVIPDDKRKVGGTILLENCPSKYIDYKAIVRLKSKKQAEVKEILGPAGKYSTEIKALLAESGLSKNKYKKYSDNIKKISNNWQEKIKKEIPSRKDFREVPTFTIDPITAKDFDDALSISKETKNIYQIGIHIADVSFYIKADDEIYEQIVSQNFSVYLPDQTIHLLPDIFSEQICSLKPNEDRLCLSTIFKINNKGEILSANLEKTIIRSKKKFSYQEAEDIINNKKGLWSEELIILNSLAEKIRQKNMEKGMLPIEEAKKEFIFNDQGQIDKIRPKTRLKAERLIEDFMLLANQQVAKMIKKNGEAHLYRIHDEPPKEKIIQFAEILKNFGLKLPLEKGEISSLSFSKFLRNIKDHPQQQIINKLAIRSLAKAEYSSSNIGHYGLALKNYCHFTSPIRRWPDLIIHYLLKDILNNNKTKKRNIGLNEENISKANTREIEIANLERQALKLKLMEYLKDKIGLESEGLITAVTSFGFFVEEEDTGAEGLVRIFNLDGYYHFDEKNLQLTSKNKRKYSLGDRVKIRLVKIDMVKNWIDFELIN